MVSDFKYYLPTQIRFGANSLKSASEYIGKNKCLLLTTDGSIKRGLLDRTSFLKDNIVHIETNVPSHPDITSICGLYDRAQDVDFDIILAIGGGSVLDAAKCLSVRSGTSELSGSAFLTGMITKKENNLPYSVTPVVAVPTTSGTSSEITPWATVWDKKEQKKHSLFLKDLFCRVAIYDPELTIGLPRETTISSALDALSHALESIWNRNASEITVINAVAASKLVLEYLPMLNKDLNNIEFRSKIMLASMFAGLSFSNTQTAVAHAISYYITLKKGVEHGIACSFTLPMLIDNIVGKYDFVDKAIINIFGELGSSRLRNMYHELGISTEFSDYNVTETDKHEIVSTLLMTGRAQNSLINIVRL
jgi:phosphonate metabolism-associated iron-containing alcohol dehydrogenase